MYIKYGKSSCTRFADAIVFAVMLLSNVIYKVQGWCVKLNNFRKNRNNPTTSGTIQLNNLQLQPMSNCSNLVSSTSKCASPTSYPNPINAVYLPGQIPSDEIPETTELNDPQPSTSHPCHTIGLTVLPIKPANYAKTKNEKFLSLNELSGTQDGAKPSSPTGSLTSRLDPVPSNTAHHAVSLGKIIDFFLQDQTFLNKAFLFAFTGKSLRINNQAYNPEVISSRLFSKLSLAQAIVGIISITFLYCIEFDSFYVFYPFVNSFFNSILLPLPIYMTNSALRTFTQTSIKEMF